MTETGVVVNIDLGKYRGWKVVMNTRIGISISPDSLVLLKEIMEDIDVECYGVITQNFSNEALTLKERLP